VKEKKGYRPARDLVRAFAENPFPNADPASILMQAKELSIGTKDPKLALSLQGLINDLKIAMINTVDNSAMQQCISIGMHWQAIVAHLGFPKPTGKTEHPVCDYIRRANATKRRGERQKEIIDRALSDYQKDTGKPCERTIQSLQKHFKKIIGKENPPLV
jgi:hypothetical protein